MTKLAPLFLFVAACGYVDPATDSGDEPMPDAQLTEPPVDGAPPMDTPVSVLGAFSAPILVSELSTSSTDSDPAMTADGLELLFHSTRPGGLGSGDIWTAKRTATNAPWGSPVPVPQLNSAGDDKHPHISADGLRIYLTVASDIFISARATRSAAWAPLTAVTELNTVAAEFRVSLTPDELLLVLDSDRGGNSGRDIYLSTRPSTTSSWSAPVPVTELNTAGSDANPMLSDDGLTIYFQRSSGIFVASRTSHTTAFGAAVRLDELGAAIDATDPWISSDQRTLMFTSNRAGNDDIYIATR